MSPKRSKRGTFSKTNANVKAQPSYEGQQQNYSPTRSNYGCSREGGESTSSTYEETQDEIMQKLLEFKKVIPLSKLICHGNILE